ncbi:hypothetical protein JW978_01725 [Candidatus Dojkabacteria bacterium]|nr:hypothetical protein [Candidatus Dojkabacteria bacterium]
MIVYYAFQKYFLNFFVWWYLVKARDISTAFWRTWLFGFVSFRVWPMLSNLFVPLYQDNSWVGRLIGFPIRLVWGGVGLIIELMFLVVLTFIFFIYLALPIIPVLGIINWFL